MKKSILLAITIVAHSFIYAQATNNTTATTTSSNGGAGNTTTTTGKDIVGFDGIAWATPYEQVKERFRDLASNPGVDDPIEIIKDTPDREILIKRKGIFYRYVFYSQPKYDPNKDEKSNVNLTENTQEENKVISRFFFVEVKMNLLPAKDLFEKLNQSYGRYTSSTQDDSNRGAYIWQKDKGLLVQIIEAFDEKPFTRSLYYLSKEISDEIKKDLKKYQFAVEYQELIDIVP